MIKIHSIIAVLLALFVGISFPIHSAHALQGAGFQSVSDLTDDSQSMIMSASISQALNMGYLEKVKFEDTPGMKAFYEARGFGTVWLESSFLSQAKAEKLLDVFEGAWKHGLNPYRYHIEQIRNLIDTAKGEQRYELDLLVSDALVRYGKDLTGMRPNPKSIGQRSKYWRQPLRGIDILDHVANASNVDEALRGIEPQGALYSKLQKELVSLYTKKDSETEVERVNLGGLIRPGGSNKAVLAIRKRMGFKAGQSPQGDYYYDDALASAVMAFQKAQGLKPDGIIGPQTVNLMNKSRDDKIKQVLVNLERLRWVESNKPSRYIMVNIPAAMLWAVNDNKVEIEMPVIVGRPKRATKSFVTQITGIRFNPTWTVPPTIKRDDYLPKLQQDPYYLYDRGIELMEGGVTVDPGLVDWNTKTWTEVNQMRMVQGSGANNPLGLVRMIMDNPYNIYLHDTPSKSKFKRADRALSSGCVRMQDALRVADFVMRPNEGWSEKRRKEILAEGKMRVINAQAPLPVYLLYQTMWIGDKGQLVYGPDIYGEDDDLLRALKNVDGVVFPVKEGEETKTASARDISRLINQISPAAGVDLFKKPE